MALICQTLSEQFLESISRIYDFVPNALMQRGAWREYGGAQRGAQWGVESMEISTEE